MKKNKKSLLGDYLMKTEEKFDEEYFNKLNSMLNEKDIILNRNIEYSFILEQEINTLKRKINAKEQETKALKQKITGNKNTETKNKHKRTGNKNTETKNKHRRTESESFKTRNKNKRKNNFKT